MCYYATTDYLCGDWKWGNMMLRCPRQHRIGETCGAKLVHHESVTKSPTICKICEEINTKQRRLSKTVDNISRWSREPDKFSASLEKAQREGKELQEKIKDLNLRRPSIATSMQSAARPSSAARTATATGATLPPVATQGYEYTSPTASHRRPETSTYNTTPRNGMAGSVGTSNVNLNPSQTTSQYASLPAASYTSRTPTAASAASAKRRA